MKYKATIMIPAFNAEKFLSESLNSALNQTYSKNYEILLVNDGSTDLTGKIAEEFAQSYPIVRVLHQSNLGIGATRNRLLKESKGEILLGLDADDRLHTNALEKIINFHKENPEAGFVYTDSRCIDEKGRIIYQGGTRAECQIYFDALIYHTNFAGHLRSFRKKAVEKFRFNSELSGPEDWDFLLKITPFVKKRHLPEILYDYRIHMNGASRSISKKIRRNITRNMLKKNILSNNLYPYAKNIEVLRIAEGDHAIYYEHLIDGLPRMNPCAKEVLIKYFASYKKKLK